MSTAGLTLAACLPDLDAEWEHLRGLLPAGAKGSEGQVAAPLRAVDRPSMPFTGRLGGRPAAAGDGCAVLAWAQSGLMHLTGCADGPPAAPSAPVLARAELLAALIGELSAAQGERVVLDMPRVLAGRAQLHGWQRRGTTSANGSCRILRAADGWLAVNLARPDDVASLPAVLGAEPPEAWPALAGHAATRSAADVAAAAQAVGIPAAALGSAPAEPLRMSRIDAGPGAAAPGAAGQPRLVLDLSAMWAGPLCARILRDAGWRVLKVEDSRRPDGARFGPPQFYAELHAGIPAVRLDFGTAAGRAELARLASRAAVVIESSRPRALRQLGLLADEWLAAEPGRIWVSITGYGRDDPQQRVAFGDDAAVAGGLVAAAADGGPVFCGDAIADPLTGVLAGAAALAAAAELAASGTGGWLADVAMARVCADFARPPAAPEFPHPVHRDSAGWTVAHNGTTASVRAWS